MKKIRFILGVVALVFAFASAFALKSTAALENPAYVNPAGQCEEVEQTCGGTKNDCVIGGVTIREFQAGTSCAAILKMGN